MIPHPEDWDSAQIPFGFPETIEIVLTKSCLSGVAIGLTAFCIELGETTLSALRLQILALAIPSWANFTLYITSGLACGFVACFLTLFLSPASSGAGVALVMANLNGLSVPTLLNTKTLFCKVVGTIFSVSCGLPVGPEGPLVHIGACISSFFTKQHYFKLKFGKHTLFNFGYVPVIPHIPWRVLNQPYACDCTKYEDEYEGEIRSKVQTETQTYQIRTKMLAAFFIKKSLSTLYELSLGFIARPTRLRRLYSPFKLLGRAQTCLLLASNVRREYVVSTYEGFNQRLPFLFHTSSGPSIL
jgi:hypothetical protein